MDYVWLVGILLCILSIVLLLWKSDRLVNLANLKKTCKARVNQRQTYEDKERITSSTRGLINEKRIQRFFIEYELEGGKFQWLEVNEKVMLGCRKNMTGQLTYRGNMFIHFEPDVQETPPEKESDNDRTFF